jgi:hypothetical protein
MDDIPLPLLAAAAVSLVLSGLIYYNHQEPTKETHIPGVMQVFDKPDVG